MRALTWPKPSTIRKNVSTRQAASTSARSSGVDANGIGALSGFLDQSPRMGVGVALCVHHPARDLAERREPHVVVLAHVAEDLLVHRGDHRPAAEVAVQRER